ncbi:Ferredoxin--NADP reductase [Pseudobythopirellula maris]|uniref:ferredoxin--NADP(+) reductase n=1 Tax=Pseudobythopirellula maris TaxID=2527991 RepID=A0A5C5ZS61_9BACT|nr:ferredoxin--NADP reductase [Pseudobythopirellula maris]TWT90329.1 Ferredoxin--NADP reductase [Pseudobythopirellula maris]
MGSAETQLTGDHVAELRKTHYNATVTWFERLNDSLLRMRVRLDDGVSDTGPALHYDAGQYTTLGMGYWEPRVEGAQAETLNEKMLQKVVKRAYSISSRLLDDDGKVVPAGDEQELEFYVALVLQADKPPALTPRLFGLKKGDRLHMGPRAKGAFTMSGLKPTDNLILAATGTGEAPHNAMLSNLLASGHLGKIACVTCVRYRDDLGYTEEHRKLEAAYDNYRYIPLTTREPENRDKDHPDYVGVTYVQDLLRADDVADRLGFELHAPDTHVFLCGNPAMIGIPRKLDHPDGRYPEPVGVVEVLEGKGFKADEPKVPGNIHYEKYW